MSDENSFSAFPSVGKMFLVRHAFLVRGLRTRAQGAYGRTLRAPGKSTQNANFLHRTDFHRCKNTPLYMLSMSSGVNAVAYSKERSRRGDDKPHVATATDKFRERSSANDLVPLSLRRLRISRSCRSELVLLLLQKPDGFLLPSALR